MHSSSSIPNGAPPSHATRKATPKYGQRLLPQVVDSLAKEDPTHVLGHAAKSEDISQGFASITTSQLSHAVNFTAHWLDAHLHNTAAPPEVIAFLGSHDFRYWVVELASIKCGHPLLMPSPRNALPNTLSLLEVTKCKVLFYTSSLREQAEALSQLAKGLKIVPILSIEEMLNGPTTHYPYDKTWEEARSDPIMIVHTSGSTGAPKPIYYTNEFIAKCTDIQHLNPETPGRIQANISLLKPKTAYFTGTPFVHLSGVMFGFHTMFWKTTAIIAPPDVPPTGKMVYEIAKTIKLSGIIVVPSLCDSVVSEYGDQILPFLDELEHVCWLGGPLGVSTGDWLMKNTKAHLWQIIGSTEVGPYYLLLPQRSHWQFLEFHPLTGPTLEPISLDSELYEIVSRRHGDGAHSFSRPVFDLFPHLEEWRSKDLVSRCKDPGCENLWKYEGRLDDMMLLSNGLKVNPLHIETRLQSHSALSGCMVFGVGYTKCGLLVEPKDPSAERDALIEEIWPSVQHANSLVPEHARIAKEMILVTDPARPLHRASKGTVIRALTTESYEKEIKDIYQA